jgi:nitrate/TMAO reductase-like tetraheme cytochrome c subunit
MLDPIRQNTLRLTATFAVAAFTYAAIAISMPGQPPEPAPLPKLARAGSSNSSAAQKPNIAQAPKTAVTPKAATTANDRSRAQADPKPILPSDIPQSFSEQEKLIFASLPPMCVPPTARMEQPTASTDKPAYTPDKQTRADADQAAPASPTVATASPATRLNGWTQQSESRPDAGLVANPKPLAAQQAVFDLTETENDFQPDGTSEVNQPDNSNHFEIDPATFQAAVQRAAASSNSFEPNPHANLQQASFSSLHSSAGATHNPPSDPTLGVAPGEDPHAEIYSRSAFPSARDCAQCHRQIYEEWSSSSHAYASISPMFHVFEDTINRLSQGTIGYFCYRCHSPVSTTMGLRRDQPIWDGPRVFREGVTCIACHRVKTPYGKVNGERRIEPGDIYDPVYGAGDGHGVAIAKKYDEVFKVKTQPSNDKRPGQAMHRRAIQFEELSKSSFCMSCHQVAVQPGIKLEVVWDQYRASPAYRDGVTCQDCHMGIVPGMDEGYSVGPGAIVNNKVINPEKKHSNHVFYGPGYSIAHPGVFPDNLDADRWTVPQWLEFDWRAGWGTDRFEDALADGQIQWSFPPIWQEADDRYDAREIVDVNLKKLEYKRDLRRQVLENGSRLDGPFFLKPPKVGEKLNFRYCITNLNPGHNMPSGSLGAQPQIWLNAVLIDPYGNRIWETGYVDSNGDLADNHSLDVLARKVPLDTQLVNLQTKFLTTNVKGTDREMYLPVNFDFDQLPFLRPPQQPVSVQNHPPFIRMEGHSIPPLGKRNAKFAVPSRLMKIPGTYRLSVRMRSRAEPIYFMRFCNATPEMQRMMNEWICDFHTATVSFEVH